MNLEEELQRAKPAHLKMEPTDYCQQKVIKKHTPAMQYLNINLKKQGGHYL